MNRTVLIPATLLCCGTLMGQVELDRALRFTGPEEERRIVGLDAPTVVDAAITVGYAVQGASHWAQASMSADTIVLLTAPAVLGYADGLFLRFLSPVNRFRRTFIQVDGGTVMPLKRTDDLDPVLGELRIGAICEVILAGDRFLLLSPQVRGCPSNTVKVNERYCIDIERRSQLNHANATVYCAQRGGRLCTWDEYYAGCTLVGSQLNNLFTDWEWINDVSDHTHSADQMGRTSCASQRAVLPTILTSARCCFSIR